MAPTKNKDTSFLVWEKKRGIWESFEVIQCIEKKKLKSKGNARRCIFYWKLWCVSHSTFLSLYRPFPGVGVCTFGTFSTLGTLIVYVWYVWYVRYVNSKKVYVWYVYVRLRCTFDGLKCTFDVRLFPTLMRFDHSE